MLRLMTAAVVLILLAPLALPADLQAQARRRDTVGDIIDILSRGPQDVRQDRRESRGDRDDWDDDEDSDDRYDDRYENDRYDNKKSRKKADKGPAFCRSGEGHPVHGRQWCRDKGWKLGNESRNDRYENDRYDDRSGRSYDSYLRDHDNFHRQLDRRYDELSSRRGVGIQDQVRLRIEKEAEHRRWHDRAGIEHR